jgi:hypothetical protein
MLSKLTLTAPEAANRALHQGHDLQVLCPWPFGGVLWLLVKDVAPQAAGWGWMSSEDVGIAETPRLYPASPR